MSTTLPDLSAPTGQREKTPRVSRKVRAACDAIVSGSVKTITAAAEKAGLSREHLSREFDKPHVRALLRAKAERTVALGAGRASARIIELLESSSDHVSFDSARHVLSVAGIAPAAQPSVNLNFDAPKAGYVIVLTGRGEREHPMVDVTSTSPEGQRTKP
jgi:hypothetical protein